MSDYKDKRYELYVYQDKHNKKKEGFFVKKFKKAMALSLALAMGLSLVACGGSTTEETEAPRFLTFSAGTMSSLDVLKITILDTRLTILMMQQQAERSAISKLSSL